MSNTPLVLAIDQGGHASRAVVFDCHGTIVASASVPIETLRPRPGWVEHDPDALAESVCKAMNTVAGALGERAADVSAAGLATQRSSIVCWDRETGRALSPVLSWQDVRGAALLEPLADQAERVHASTGLVLSPHYGASKLRWCLDHLPAVREAETQGRLAFGPLASFLVARLTRERTLVVDPANAARTLVWSLASRDWCDELLGLFDLPRAALPRCVPSRYAYGHIDLGGREVPLTVVTGDQSAAVFALGEPEPDVAQINLGTGAFVQRLVGAAPRIVPGLLAGIIWHDGTDGQYVLEGTVNGAGSALETVGAQRGLDPGAAFAAAARGLAQAGELPVFVNGIGGLGSPFWRSDLASRFVPQDAGADEMLAAVVESVVFLLTVNLELMHAHVGPPERLRVAGGLSGLDGLCARLASTARIRVERPAALEATAHGLARLIANRPSHAQVHETFEPQTDVALADRYRRWRTELEQSLKTFRAS